MACPQCGFPIAAEIVARSEREAAEAERAARERVGDVDCAVCDARGFVTEGPEDGVTAFAWCVVCQHSGRVPLVRSPKGYYAVAFSAVEGFVQGGAWNHPNVVFLGGDAPPSHRYEQAGARHPDDDSS